MTRIISYYGGLRDTTAYIPVRDYSTRFSPQERDLQIRLRSRNQVERRKALDQLIRMPSCQKFIDDVEQLCVDTRCRETWKKAKGVLWSLDPDRAVAMDRTHPFSELKQWKAAQA